MALIRCKECDREVSDKAEVCPQCGAPVAAMLASALAAPSRVTYDNRTGMFNSTRPALAKLAAKSIQELGWKVQQINESGGLVTFETGMSWGSWSGIAGSVTFEEVSAYNFKVVGAGKQNIRGAQMAAFNIAGEAQSKARKVIEKMQLSAR